MPYTPKSVSEVMVTGLFLGTKKGAPDSADSTSLKSFNMRASLVADRLKMGFLIRIPSGYD